MDFEKAFSNEIPLHEAADFFLRVKKADVTEPPDETGELEGLFAAPVEQVLAVMKLLVENEFKTMVAYHVYANTLRDLSHVGIAEEFEEHAEAEVEHADFLLRRMAVLGGPVQLSDIPTPSASSDPIDIVKTMIRYEQEGITKWQALHSMMGENPTKYEIENFLTRELHHLDELWQLLPHTEHTPVLQDKGIDPAQALQQVAQQPAAEPPEKSASIMVPAVMGGLSGYGPARNVAGETAAAMAPEGRVTRSENIARQAAIAGAPLGALGGLVLAKKYNLASKLIPVAKHLASAPHQVEEIAGFASPFTASMGGAIGGGLAAGGATGLVQKVRGPLKSDQKASERKKAAAAMRMKLAFLKIADEGAAAVDSAQMSPPSPGQTMPTNYLEAEQTAQHAQNQNEATYYRGLLQTMQMKTQALQQQMESANQQMADIQTQVAETDAGAQAATEQATQSQIEARQHAQMAANMRLGMEKLRTQLFDIASQEPGITSPIPGQPMAGEPEAAGQGTMSQQMALDSGASPDSALGGESVAGTQGAQGPAGGAPGASGTPMAAPSAAGNESARNAPGTGKPTSTATAEPTTFFETQKELPKAASVRSAVTGAALGGLVGGGGTYLEARKGSGALKQKVHDLESKKGGFGHALNMAQAKTRLALREAIEEHPVAATGTGAVAGALSGAQIGKVAPSMARETARQVRRMVG